MSSTRKSQSLMHLPLNKRCAMVLSVTIAVSGAAYTFCLGTSRVPANICARYGALAEQASASHHHDTARLCYDWLLRRDPMDRHAALGLAMSCDALGQQDACDALIFRLTALKETEYFPAHLFAAERLLSRSSPTDQDLRQAEAHLLKVVRAQPRHAEAVLLLSTLKERRSEHRVPEKIGTP